MPASWSVCAAHDAQNHFRMARIQRIQDDLQRLMRVEIDWDQVQPTFQIDHTRFDRSAFDRSASRITPRNTSGADPVENGSLKHIIITILIIFI